MRKTEIEYWALSIIDRVLKKQPIEDDRVELKREWIDPASAARRIAAHANASFGEQILWLIGVDEKDGVVGADYTECGNWFSKIESQFDQIAPEYISLNVASNGATVAAILFETDRAPYVIKNPEGGRIQFEVPWRAGTNTRTANRSQLLRILVPLQKVPKIDVLTGRLSARSSGADKNWQWVSYLQLYVGSVLQQPLIIPFHKCSCTLTLGQHLPGTCLSQITMHPSRKLGLISASMGNESQIDSLTIEGTSTELIIHGPGLINFRAECVTNPIENIKVSPATIHLHLQPVDVEHSISLTTEFSWVGVKSNPNSIEVREWKV